MTRCFVAILVALMAIPTAAAGEFCGNAVFERQKRLRAESRVGGEPLARTLIEELGRETDHYQRIDLRMRLAWTNTRLAARYLRDELYRIDSYGSREGWQTVVAVGETRDPDSVPDLLNVWERTSDGQTRHLAAHRAWQLSRNDCRARSLAIEWLEERLKANPSWVAAAKLLRNMSGANDPQAVLCD